MREPEEDPAHGIHLHQIPELSEAAEAGGINITGREKKQKASEYLEYYSSIEQENPSILSSQTVSRNCRSLKHLPAASFYLQSPTHIAKFSL